MIKKSMLFIVSCMLPLTSSPICLKYAEGPSDMERISVYADATKAGSYLPTGGPFFKELQLKGTALQFPDLLRNHAFITIRGGGLTRAQYTFGDKVLHSGKTAHSTGEVLVRGEELKNNASYEIIIDADKKVSFREVDSMCKQ